MKSGDVGVEACDCQGWTQPLCIPSFSHHPIHTMYTYVLVGPLPLPHRVAHSQLP